jgi:hypothetical protein
MISGEAGVPTDFDWMFCAVAATLISAFWADELAAFGYRMGEAAGRALLMIFGGEGD